MATKRDYYEVLGIAKSASADEIKKAFRRLAVQHHPDKAGGDETKFKEINEAYEVLSNTEKRQRYDQFGHAGVGGSGQPGGGNPFGGFGSQGQNVNFDFGDLGLGDIFGSFFGGGQGGQQRTARGQDVAVDVTLSFEEAIFGTDRELTLTLNDTCEHCKGSGAEPGHSLKTCPTCQGSGQVNRVMNTVFGQIRQAVVCDVCRGHGKVPEKDCSVCHGRGALRRPQTIKLKIPAGIDDGSTIRLNGRGEAPSTPGSASQKGDLYVQIRVKAHKQFTREGNLVLSHQSIDMPTAALGGQLEVRTVDGPVTMKIPPGTQSGTDFKLAGHGVPNVRSGVRGPHIVTVDVATPVKLSKKQKELLEEFRNTRPSFFGSL